MDIIRDYLIPNYSIETLWLKKIVTVHYRKIDI